MPHAGPSSSSQRVRARRPSPGALPPCPHNPAPLRFDRGEIHKQGAEAEACCARTGRQATAGQQTIHTHIVRRNVRARAPYMRRGRRPRTSCRWLDRGLAHATWRRSVSYSPRMAAACWRSPASRCWCAAAFWAAHCAAALTCSRGAHGWRAVRGQASLRCSGRCACGQPRCSAPGRRKQPPAVGTAASEANRCPGQPCLPAELCTGAHLAHHALHQLDRPLDLRHLHHVRDGAAKQHLLCEVGEAGREREGGCGVAGARAAGRARQGGTSRLARLPACYAAAGTRQPCSSAAA